MDLDAVHHKVMPMRAEYGFHNKEVVLSAAFQTKSRRDELPHLMRYFGDLQFHMHS